MTRKILVTGGAGFIGSHIVDKYLSLGHEVAIVDDLTTGKKENINSRAKFYKVDLRDKRSIAKVMHRERPEIINHQAAQKSVSNSVEDPTHDAGINVIGFLNLMEEAKPAGVKKVIFASTGGAIYGDAKEVPTPETYPPQPVSPYAITKFTTEQYLRFYNQTAGITPVVLRYSNVYGPRQDPFGEAGVVAIFSKLIAQNKSLSVFGDGKQTRDYVFVEDVAQASVKALKYQPKDFDSAIINIGTGIETPLNDIVTLLEKASGKKAEVKHEPARAGDLLRSAIAITKADKLLGWTPAVALKTGIEKTYKFFE